MARVNKKKKDSPAKGVVAAGPTGVKAKVIKKKKDSHANGAVAAGPTGNKGGQKVKPQKKGKGGKIPETDPCGLFINFPENMTPNVATKLIEAGKKARKFTLGRTVLMYFNNPDEAKAMENQLSKINFGDKMKPQVKAAFKEKNEAKKRSVVAAAKEPPKKKTKSEVVKVEKAKEESDEEEDEDSDEEEDEDSDDE